MLIKMYVVDKKMKLNVLYSIKKIFQLYISTVIIAEYIQNVYYHTSIFFSNFIIISGCILKNANPFDRFSPIIYLK